MNRTTRFLLTAIPFLFLVSCSPLRNLGPDAVLLRKNVIKSDQRKINDDLKRILKQKPNRKMLSMVRFHLGVHTLFNRGRERKWKTWFKTSIGEPPVLLDTTLTLKSRNQIKQYMLNHGYFNAEVTTETHISKKRKAKVTYNVSSGKPYRIRKVTYVIPDTKIAKLVQDDASNTLIGTNHVFNTRVLQEERERITSVIKNNGYYFFTQQYISYKIDSGLNANEVVIYLQLQNPVARGDTTRQAAHVPYRIGKVFMTPDHRPSGSPPDGLADTIRYLDKAFIYTSGKHNFRPAVLSRNTFILSDSLYRLKAHERTYEYLSELGTFRFVNIGFRVDSAYKDPTINGYINLTPNFRQNYRVEIEGTHNGGNLGAAGSFVYTNRNIFKGAELFELRLKTALEDQKNFAGVEEKFLVFNTYEFGPELNLTIPVKGSKKVYRFSTSYNLQNRPEFNRRLINFSSGVALRRKRSFTLLLNPIELNFVKVRQSEEFRTILEEINDPGLSESYDDHLIPAGVYSFILNTQRLDEPGNFFYFRMNFETAGFLIRMAQEAAGNVTERDSNYSIFNNTYAQYIRPDADFRFYQIIDDKNTLVYRLAGGVGIPYWNSSQLPFEKSFFAGGANDLRAFVARGLGPGTFDDPVDVQQNGEIKINANAEYRFDIFKILKGALFADAGNVWLLEDAADRPGGKFRSDRFLKEIALGAGFGVRFDFNYFVVRLDVGFPVRDPRNAEQDRWVHRNLKWRDATTNFGIGYPF